MKCICKRNCKRCSCYKEGLCSGDCPKEIDLHLNCRWCKNNPNREKRKDD